MELVDAQPALRQNLFCDDSSGWPAKTNNCVFVQIAQAGDNIFQDRVLYLGTGRYSLASLTRLKSVQASKNCARKIAVCWRSGQSKPKKLPILALIEVCDERLEGFYTEGLSRRFAKCKVDEIPRSTHNEVG